jgi:hypothetical protein
MTFILSSDFLLRLLAPCLLHTLTIGHMQRVSPPEKLAAQTVDSQHSMPFQFFTSLPRFRSGWFANKALQRTAADRRGCNHSFSAPLSLSFRR